MKLRRPGVGSSRDSKDSHPARKERPCIITKHVHTAVPKRQNYAERPDQPENLRCKRQKRLYKPMLGPENFKNSQAQLPKYPFLSPLQ